MKIITSKNSRFIVGMTGKAKEINDYFKLIKNKKGELNYR